MLSKLSKLLLVVSIASLAIPLVSRVVARKFIFATQDVRAVTPLVDSTEHHLHARDGVAVRVLELPSKPGAAIVDHFHNNREVAEQTGSIARELAARGLPSVAYRADELHPSLFAHPSARAYRVEERIVRPSVTRDATSSGLR